MSRADVKSPNCGEGAFGGNPCLAPPPTCVGKTRCRSTMTSSPWKHPHVRGEDFTRINARPAIQETPPRAWGRLVRSDDTQGNRRNTPTCVGKTCWRRLSLSCCRKHPHVRGEDLAYTSHKAQLWETPPRAWGRPLRPPVPRIPVRNTPTCVGKTHTPAPTSKPV